MMLYVAEMVDLSQFSLQRLQVKLWEYKAIMVVIIKRENCGQERLWKYSMLVTKNWK